jgi:hypothetical protein
MRKTPALLRWNGTRVRELWRRSLLLPGGHAGTGCRPQASALVRRPHGGRRDLLLSCRGTRGGTLGAPPLRGKRAACRIATNTR